MGCGQAKTPAEAAQGSVKPAPVAAPNANPGTPNEAQPNSKSNQESAQPKEDASPVLFPEGVFPPANPGPVHAKSEQPGDGVWRPFFEESPDGKLQDRTTDPVDGSFAKDVVVRAVFHPHETSRFQTLTIAAFDLRALLLAHRPGQQDVLDVGHPELAPLSGVVPQNEQSDLLAVFNEGFQPRHGRWGMLSLGVQLVPPREDGCTVAVGTLGTLLVAPWPELSGKLEQISAYRQTPPCLVIDGAVHPELAQGKLKRWAGQQPDLRTLRRSAIGVSADGRTLFYGLGREMEADVLAAGMAHVGARYAAQLDINWNWTRLFLFRPGTTPTEVSGSLVKDMARDKGEYVTRPGKRGFFYLLRREKAASSSAP